MPGPTATQRQPPVRQRPGAPRREQPARLPARPSTRQPAEQPASRRDPLPELLTATEAALLLHVSLRTLQRMKRAGVISYVELDTGSTRPSVRYTRDDVAACLRGSQRGGRESA